MPFSLMFSESTPLHTFRIPKLFDRQLGFRVLAYPLHKPKLCNVGLENERYAAIKTSGYPRPVTGITSLHPHFLGKQS